jgi:hypothetical protein
MLILAETLPAPAVFRLRRVLRLVLVDRDRLAHARLAAQPCDFELQHGGQPQRAARLGHGRVQPHQVGAVFLALGRDLLRHRHLHVAERLQPGDHVALQPRPAFGRREAIGLLRWTWFVHDGNNTGTTGLVSSPFTRRPRRLAIASRARMALRMKTADHRLHAAKR